MEGNQCETYRPPIREVPLTLKGRKNYDRYFKPRAVSIGPLHHGKDELAPAEKFKERLVAEFIKASGRTKDFLHQMIEKDIERFKDCYEKKVIRKYSNEKLAQILFVDGCAVLQFIHYKKLEKLKHNIKNDLAAFAAQDLFLLENQLPFEVLDLLMNNSEHGVDLRESIQHFVDMNMEVHPKEGNLYSQPTHLLDLLRTRLLLPHEGNLDVAIDIPVSKWPTFRNIMELKAAGIHVKRSNTSCLKDTHFKSRFLKAILELPSMIVDDSTAPKFLNLVAYEMCPEFPNEFEVSSYLCFMDSLIDHPEDVKELRKANILHNLLGSDEEVSTLFNEISTDLVPNPNAYSFVKQQIQLHYDKTWKTWIAQGYHDHFSSPWTFLAFMAAIIGLILSFIQALPSLKPDHCLKVCTNHP
ncbi:hypothetical protein GH714_036495 [Hevea brasiliensis]|uniref:Uncharacterized protein n=1 Tax=Hevea brasiliensis TaxID=3981 RepID=A0A6A6M710_HEVBR|nr:hypothetical protein GH714_036495 [Hevea brasiliensis]